MTTSTHAFHTTRWTVIGNACGETPEARQALSELCATYYAPVVAFLRRDDDAARELAHEFFAKVLAGDSLHALAFEILIIALRHLRIGMDHGASSVGRKPPRLPTPVPVQ